MMMDLETPEKPNFATCKQGTLTQITQNRSKIQYFLNSTDQVYNGFERKSEIFDLKLLNKKFNLHQCASRGLTES